MTDHILDFGYSKDGGHNSENWRQADVGATGEFQSRAVFRRLGRGRQFVFHIRDSSPYKRDVLAASMQIEGEG